MRYGFVCLFHEFAQSEGQSHKKKVFKCTFLEACETMYCGIASPNDRALLKIVINSAKSADLGNSSLPFHSHELALPPPPPSVIGTRQGSPALGSPYYIFEQKGLISTVHLFSPCPFLKVKIAGVVNLQTE